MSDSTCPVTTAPFPITAAQEILAVPVTSSAPVSVAPNEVVQLTVKSSVNVTSPVTHRVHPTVALPVIVSFQPTEMFSLKIQFPVNVELPATVKFHPTAVLPLNVEAPATVNVLLNVVAQVTHNVPVIDSFHPTVTSLRVEVPVDVTSQADTAQVNVEVPVTDKLPQTVSSPVTATSAPNVASQVTFNVVQIVAHSVVVILLADTSPDVTLANVVAPVTVKSTVVIEVLADNSVTVVAPVTSNVPVIASLPEIEESPPTDRLASNVASPVTHNVHPTVTFPEASNVAESISVAVNVVIFQVVDVKPSIVPVVEVNVVIVASFTVNVPSSTFKLPVTVRGQFTSLSVTSTLERFKFSHCSIFHLSSASLIETWNSCSSIHLTWIGATQAPTTCHSHPISLLPVGILYTTGDGTFLVAQVVVLATLPAGLATCGFLVLGILLFV